MHPLQLAPPTMIMLAWLPARSCMLIHLLTTRQRHNSYSQQPGRPRTRRTAKRKLQML
ncbi:hypothetical protein BC831DRAFT_252465 [Entophlyctis helioformis]|nr:hypothetical protein BC831DRAFT_252465 [Entophlyctis helioformis]